MLFLEKDKTLLLPFLTSVTKLLHPQLFNPVCVWHTGRLISSFNLIFGDNFYGDALSKSGRRRKEIYLIVNYVYVGQACSNTPDFDSIKIKEL